MIQEIANTLIKKSKEIESSHMPYISFMAVVRRAFSHEALLKHRGNVLKASNELNMNRRTFISNLGMSSTEWKKKFLRNKK